MTGKIEGGVCLVRSYQLGKSAGVVGLTQHTRTLEEIFLTLTAPKEVG